MAIANARGYLAKPGNKKTAGRKAVRLFFKFQGGALI
jgi:hypothetical protein